MSIKAHCISCCAAIQTHALVHYQYQVQNQLGLISALKYLHSKCILHNDIKSDNVVVEYTSSRAKGVLVDLGKACYVSDAKQYTLSKEERQAYAVNHPDCPRP